MAFWQLTVPSSPDTSEGLTNFLWEQGALGVVEEESPLTSPRLRAFFPDSASSTTLVSSTQRYVAGLHALGFPAASGEIEIAPLLEEAWASAWQQSFPPHAVGRRLWIAAPGSNHFPLMPWAGVSGSRRHGRRWTLPVACRSSSSRAGPSARVITGAPKAASSSSTWFSGPGRRRARSTSA